MKCKTCKKEFTYKRNKIYCSRKCKDRAYTFKHSGDKNYLARRRKYYLENIERYRQQEKQRYQKNTSKKIKSVLRYYYKHRDKILKYQINRLERLKKINPLIRDKYKIRIKSRCLYPLETSKCQVCSSTKDLQRHHRDYKNPKDILILCRKCHNNLHRAAK